MGCAGVGASGILSALAQLRVMGAVAADAVAVSRAAASPADYKALVCLFLNGGNDANSMIVPVDPSSHGAYAQTRGDLAVGESMLLPLAPVDLLQDRIDEPHFLHACAGVQSALAFLVQLRRRDGEYFDDEIRRSVQPVFLPELLAGIRQKQQVGLHHRIVDSRSLYSCSTHVCLRSF